MELYNLNEVRNLEYCRATAGKRFANYIIDLIFFYILIIGFAILIDLYKPEIFEQINGVLDRLITMICYGFLMILTEAACHGKSLGKLITGTKAVNFDGTEIGFQKSIYRNIIRIIPFNAFSALGAPCNPWHDKWSGTLVIDEKMFSIRKRSFQFPPVQDNR